VAIGSPILNTRCPLDQSPVTRGSTEEKYRSDPLDLSTRTNNHRIQYNCEEDNGREPSSNSAKCEIMMRSEPLDPEDTWREINISLTRELEKSKVSSPPTS
jgi:hypothetical protein